ncbi:MAG: hypothetical protein HY804_08930 [Nitrospinae bacterium]|nr:hypothetical protein [Nitrospinota bacterium]
MYKAEIIGKQAQFNAPISGLADTSRFKKYKDCLAIYGAALGQAYLNLISSIRETGGRLTEDELTGDSTVQSLNSLDLYILAGAAVREVISRGLTDGRVKSGYRNIIRERGECRFAGSTSQILCGGVHVVIADGRGTSMTAYGVPWFGDAYAGYRGDYRVSRGDKESERVSMAMRRFAERSRSASAAAGLSRWIPAGQ